MKVLIACEESQRVCTAFRERGHEAYSCDIQECSGGHPEWHIMQDVIPLLNGDCQFMDMRGGQHVIDGKWNLIIAHPPCTYLTNVATRHHSIRCSTLDKINERTLKRIEAMRFFMAFVMADCDKISVENPVGIMNTAYRTPDQIINPYQFAEDENDPEAKITKATCLWLKNLNPLLPTGYMTGNMIPKPDNSLNGRYPSGKTKTWEEMVTTNSSKTRSVTFRGIARAIAEQWG